MSYEKETRALMFVVVVACVGIIGFVFGQVKCQRNLSHQTEQPITWTDDTSKQNNKTQIDINSDIRLDTGERNATIDKTYYEDGTGVVKAKMYAKTAFWFDKADDVTNIHCNCDVQHNGESINTNLDTTTAAIVDPTNQEEMTVYHQLCDDTCITFGENHFGLN